MFHGRLRESQALLMLAVLILAVLSPHVSGVQEPSRAHTDAVLEILPGGGARTRDLAVARSHLLRPAEVISAVPSGAQPSAVSASSSLSAIRRFFGAQTKGAKADEDAVKPSQIEGSDALEKELQSDYGIDVSNFTRNYTHTWGDAEHNIMGLPSYAAVIVGALVSAFIVICTNGIGNRLAHPLPFLATDEQKMKDLIEQAKEKVRILEAAVEAKRSQETKDAEEERRKAAGEPPPADGPSHDELVGELLYRTQEVQKQAVGAVNDSIKQAAPLLARAAHVQNVFSESVAGVQERVGDLAFREATQMYGKMKDAVGMEDGLDVAGAMGASLTGYELPNWFKLDDESELDPPPFALLLGGMFAPAQIKSTRGQCNTEIIWNSVILATCSACFIMDAHHGCPDPLVWGWIYGMLTINALDVICCSCIASRCATQLGILQEDEDSMMRIKKTGNNIWDMYITLQANSGQFFKAYFAYQGIIDSYMYTCQKILSFVAMLWGSLSMWITIEDIVPDTLTCDAKIILWFMHMYSWFFLLFLTWTLLGLMLWIVQKLAGFTCVTAPIMVYAKSADDEVPFNMPVFQTLARSFLLRDSSTMLHIKARQVESDVTSLEQEIKDMKTKLLGRKGYLDQLESRRIASAASETKLIEKYKQKVRENGGTLPDDPPPDQSEDPDESGSGPTFSGSPAPLATSNIFGGVPSGVDFMQQAETAAAGIDWNATYAQGQAAASSAASSAQAAASSAAASPEAQAYLQQAQGAAASAQEAATTAAASAQDSVSAAAASPEVPAEVDVDVGQAESPTATGASTEAIDPPTAEATSTSLATQPAAQTPDPASLQLEQEDESY